MLGLHGVSSDSRVWKNYFELKRDDTADNLLRNSIRYDVLADVAAGFTKNTDGFLFQPLVILRDGQLAYGIEPRIVSPHEYVNEVLRKAYGEITVPKPEKTATARCELRIINHGTRDEYFLKTLRGLRKKSLHIPKNRKDSSGRTLEGSEAVITQVSASRVELLEDILATLSNIPKNHNWQVAYLHKVKQNK